MSNLKPFHVSCRLWRGRKRRILRFQIPGRFDFDSDPDFDLDEPGNTRVALRRKPVFVSKRQKTHFINE